jgi:hypothetical protein
MQVDSLFKALDSLKLPAVIIVLGAWVSFELRSLKKNVHDKNIALEKTINDMNIAKEDKTVVAQLSQDFKGMTQRHVDAVKTIDARHIEAQKKADQRARVHELTIVALAPDDQKHHVIADLKGD